MDFAVESNRGDIMLLGNTSWMIQRIETNAGRMLVQDAHGAPPTVPFWRGGSGADSGSVARNVDQLREKISTMLPHSLAGRVFGDACRTWLSAVVWLKDECGSR